MTDEKNTIFSSLRKLLVASAVAAAWISISPFTATSSDNVKTDWENDMRYVQSIYHSPYGSYWCWNCNYNGKECHDPQNTPISCEEYS